MKRLATWIVIGGGLLLFAATDSGAEEEYKPNLDNGKLKARDCEQCHDLTSQKKYNVGPYLWGIVGQRAGRVPGFKYTRRHMAKADNIVWDEKTLDEYLTSPRKFVPGTSMAYVGIPSATDRADLIAFLKTLK